MVILIPTRLKLGVIFSWIDYSEIYFKKAYYYYYHSHFLPSYESFQESP